MHSILIASDLVYLPIIKANHQANIVIGIEVVTLTTTDLNALAAKTRVLLNTVGPYHLYSTPVVEACVENGTHYLDVSVCLCHLNSV